MPDSFSSYNELIEQFITNRLSPDDLDKFFLFLEQTRFREKYGEKIDLDFLEEKFTVWTGTRQAERVYEQIVQRAGIEQSQGDITGSSIPGIIPVRTKRGSRYIFRWAAVIALMLSAVAYYMFQANRRSPEAMVNIKKTDKQEILPGSNKAVLTLASGKKIELSDSATTITDEGLSIDQQNGRLSYRNSKVFSMNTMTTPAGGQYQLTLADGTKVWLNAASSITFPTAFPDHVREVSITGEVYFEVTKNAQKPFKVSFNKQQVEVLGTSFNINAYPEESANTTTLVEGLVRISRDKQALILHPSEQAVAHKKLEINKSADVSQVLAWKNGTFNFNGQDFAASMRQLERWYEIKVVYDNGIPTEKFGGEIDRNMTLNQALKVLNGIVANFKLEGNVLHVLPTP